MAWANSGPSVTVDTVSCSKQRGWGGPLVPGILFSRLLVHPGEVRAKKGATMLVKTWRPHSCELQLLPSSPPTCNPGSPGHSCSRCALSQLPAFQASLSTTATTSRTVNRHNLPIVLCPCSPLSAAPTHPVHPGRGSGLSPRAGGKTVKCLG